jgi:hypothetical protein
MMTPRRLVTLLAVALGAGALACGDADLGPFEVQARRAAWDAREPIGYEIDIVRSLRSCFCLPEATGPVTVVVMGGEVTQRTYTDDGAEVDPRFAASFTDIDGLFDYLDDLARRDAHQLEVEFDEEYGYPRRIIVDLDERMADDEHSVTVLAFRPALTSAPAARAP